MAQHLSPEELIDLVEDRERLSGRRSRGPPQELPVLSSTG